MATGVIKKMFVTKTFTETTGESGNVNLSSYVPITANIINVTIPSNNIMCIPFSTPSERYAKCLKWNMTSYTTVNNTAVTGTVTYLT